MNRRSTTRPSSIPFLFGGGKAESGALWFEGALAAAASLAPVIPMFPSTGLPSRRLHRPKA
jgi:hypothetical protein